MPRNLMRASQDPGISEPVIDLLITYCNLFNFLVGLFSTYGDLFGPSLNKCK